MEQGTIEGYYRGTIYRYPCSLPGLRKAACARSTWFCSPGAVGGPIQLRTWATFLVARGAIRPTTGPETNASRGTCDHVLPRSPSRGPAMAAASMESCRFVARRSPGGHFWSVVDVRKRLHRVRHPFHQSIHINQGAQLSIQREPKSSMFWIQSSLESTKHRRMRPRGPPDLRPIPDGVREPICPRKK